MKHLITAGVSLLIGGISQNLMAGACLDDGYNQGPLTPTQMIRQLSGKRVIAATPDGSEDWKEDHCETTNGNPGALYKVGDGTPVDPRAFRGTWTPRAGGGPNPQRVIYRYTVGGNGNAQYAWTLWRNRTTNDLCWERLDGSEIIAIGAKPTDAAGSPCDIP